MMKHVVLCNKLFRSQNKKNKANGVVLFSMLALLLSVPNELVYAQSGGEELVIEEITVTSRRRAENLQEIPVSVTAFSSTDIEELAITDITHVSQLTPNLMIMQSLGGSDSAAVCMRGQCRTDFPITEDPMVGVYIDGVYVSKAVGSLFDLAEIERVEVLRGPQGTLYGKNTLGGALLMHTRKPSGDFGFKSTLTAGDFGRRNVKTYLEFPVGDNVAASLSLLSKRHDPYVKNNFDGITGDSDSPGSDREDEDNTGLRVALRFTPNDKLIIDYAGDWQKKRELPSSPQLTDATGFNHPFGPGIALGDRYAAGILDDYEDRVSTYGISRMNLDIRGHSLTIKYDISDSLSLKSITGVRLVHTDWRNNATGAQGPFLYSKDLLDLDSRSQEFQLSGSAINDFIDYVVGVYYADDEGYYENDQVIEPFQADNFSFTTIDNTSAALFGEVTFNITKQLEASIGLRYTDEEREASHTVTDNASGFTYFDTNAQTFGADPVTFVPLSRDLPTEIDETSTSPRFSVSYQWNEDLMTFFTYAKGFKSGGFNARSFTPVEWEPYDDVTLDSYELGLKSSWLNKRVKFNATFYREDIEDMQAQVNSVNPDSAQGFAVVVKNAAEATVNGFELELVARVITGLDISVGYGYTDAEYDDFISSDFTGSLVDISDNRDFEFTPKRSYNLSLNYVFPQAVFSKICKEGTLVGRVDYSGMSDHVFTPKTNGNDDIAQDGYGIVNLRLAHEDIPAGTGSMNLALWVRNAGDKEYRIGGYEIDASPVTTDPNTSGLGRGSFSQWGEPRTFGIDLIYRYGSMK